MSTDVLGFSVVCRGMGTLIVYLPMQIGTIELVPRSAIHIDDYVLWESEDGTVYEPWKEPFTIKVSTLSSLNKTIPYIEGTMEGTLYNKENFKDSVVVHDAFFFFH